ncbi:DUF885 family protein [Pacificimonas pallii]|nr:DUF885 family protein [Pacificimonas pallii]
MRMSGPNRLYLLPVFAAMFLLLTGFADKSSFDATVDRYIEEWTEFYPSRAYSEGHQPSAARFEDFAKPRIDEWVAYNRQVAGGLTADDIAALPFSKQIDARVLMRQIRSEIEQWEQDRILSDQPLWYAETISQALTHLLVRDDLSDAEKRAAMRARLAGVRALAQLGSRNLTAGNQDKTADAISILRQTAGFYESRLPAIISSWGSNTETGLGGAVSAIRSLADHIEARVLPHASVPHSYGPEAYRRKLEIYTDGTIKSAELAQIARAEIRLVRRMMIDVSREWWQDTHGGAVPADPELLGRAIAAMEDDRVQNGAELLKSFTELTAKAETFIRENDLATLPDPRTLFIALSPEHFSGAAVGGVYPTGPFSPQADTLFYLPYVPDDAPAERKAGFYRSFNDHFNTMIISHEMFPGHYMQYKTAVLYAPPVRTLFANQTYVEGWGTFTEELMLDAGWADGNRLTRLAHLRKRLENATRAYTSVMVHSEGWSERQLTDFATTEGLLAPQFATNLWHRVVRDPLQLTTYFLGYRAFGELWAAEQARLGDRFSTRDFVDGVLRAGPVPVDAMPAVLADSRKTVLTGMFEWWNAEFASDRPFTQEGFGQYFTDDIVFEINGRRSPAGLKSLTERFNAIKDEYHSIEIVLPMREEFVSGDRIFTYHVNRGKKDSADPPGGYTHVMGYAEIKDGKIDLINFFHFDEDGQPTE